MHLILWRHAEAEDLHPQGDAQRALTARGKLQATLAAQWLNSHLSPDARILASPAQRTMQTAHALARPFAQDERLFTDTGVNAHLDVLSEAWSVGTGTLVLVGHQPTLGEMAAQLLCGESQAWSVRKGNVWWLQARNRGDAGQWLIRAVIDPEWISN